MRAKISMIAVNMTAYPSVRKPALDAPEPVELEFASDRAFCTALGYKVPVCNVSALVLLKLADQRRPNTRLHAISRSL